MINHARTLLLNIAGLIWVVLVTNISTHLQAINKHSSDGSNT
jgi:hypothetical protein